MTSIVTKFLTLYHTGIIGKKHVGPADVYKFDFEATEKNGYSLDQVGRNITKMKELVRKFLSHGDSPFLLYIGIHDTHRGSAPFKHGQFMEKWGTGDPQHGLIPDWEPIHYEVNLSQFHFDCSFYLWTSHHWVTKFK